MVLHFSLKKYSDAEEKDKVNILTFYTLILIHK